MGKSSAKSKLKKQNKIDLQNLEDKLNELLSSKDGVYSFFFGEFDRHRLHLISIEKITDDAEKSKEIQKTQTEVNNLVKEIDNQLKKVKDEIDNNDFDLEHVKSEEAKSRLMLQTMYRRMDAKVLPYRRASELYDPETYEEIVSEFVKAHAFIPQWAYEGIMTRAFDGWGIDKNFVGTIPEGNACMIAAKNAESETPGTGITTLENKCKVSPGSWSTYDKKPTNRGNCINQNPLEHIFQGFPKIVKIQYNFVARSTLGGNFEKV